MTSTLLEPEPSSIQVEPTPMGRVVAQVEISNLSDDDKCDEGLIRPEQVRRIAIEALVDTGSTLLCLPEDQIQKLGLKFYRESVSKIARGQKVVRRIFGPVNIKVMGRIDSVLAMEGKPGVPALLGQIPLEGLDLMVDSKRQRLVPGHPDSPNEQVVDMY
jgi:predicted aspartyl protease